MKNKKESFIGAGIVREKSFKQVAQMAKDNHIWINAFMCINPTKEFKEKIGEDILRMLNNKDKLLHQEDYLCNMLYLSINKS